MCRLLIVDDERTVCESIQSLIDWREYGFSGIMTATSYSEAVSTALDVQPHLALVDVHLGDRMGYELVEQLSGAGLKTVFAMISDREDTGLMRRSMRANAQDFLIKPIQAAELQGLVERAREIWHGLYPEAVPAPAPADLDPVLHRPCSDFSKLTNKILMVVHSSYHQPQSLVRMAEDFRMNSKYMGRVFYKDTGMRFCDYLTAYRMLEAKRLILDTQEKISNIAAMVGCTQLNNFYIHFKQYYGVSPCAMRRQEGGLTGPEEHREEEVG